MFVSLPLSGIVPMTAGRMVGDFVVGHLIMGCCGVFTIARMSLMSTSRAISLVLLMTALLVVVLLWAGILTALVPVVPVIVATGPLTSDALVEKIEALSPRSLVAKKKAMVAKIYVEKGQPEVQVNDYVKKGQVLVSGLIGKEDNKKSIAAVGEVLGAYVIEER
jgi:hypothetical protein